MGNKIARLGVGWLKSTASFPKLDNSRRENYVRPRDTMPSKTLFLALVLVTSCLWAQEEKKETPPPAGATTAAQPATPPAPTISAEDKARKNPVKFTDVSVARGKKIFSTQCAL